ncbi:phosphatidylinositol phosphatase PTPRQ isoform X2 [Leptinotarsa decemlineata]|uniref:phosphatidylinositol phosphatase PTPRQ isoform X2 n=1 Tax=Leptinotarsa decemlineata TaxID=7539 RepID=UPI003D309DF6
MSMRVVFCVLFLTLFLFAWAIGRADDIYQTERISGETANDWFLEATEAPPRNSVLVMEKEKMVRISGNELDDCSYLKPPVIYNATNTTKITPGPAILWKFAANLSGCNKSIILITTCTNVKKDNDNEIFEKDVIRKNETLYQTLILKHPILYRCEGKLVTGSTESSSSGTVVISNEKTENEDHTGTKLFATEPEESGTSSYIDESTREATSGSTGPVETAPSSPKFKLELTSIPAEHCTLEPPVIKNYTNTSVSVINPTIFWSWYRNETCENNFTLSVICTNVENESDDTTTTIDVSDTVEVSTELVELKDQTIYQCYGILGITNTSEKSLPSETIIVSTIITASITIINITTTSRSIFIEWAPLSPDLQYWVEVVELNAGHFVPPCGKASNTTVNNPTNQTFFNFTHAYPDYNYYIVISTSIRNIPISSDVKYTITPAAASEAPRNVTVDDLPNDDGSPNISMVLTWKMPCKTNGRIQRFDIDLIGIYTPDQTIKHAVTANYSLIQDQENFVYNQKMLTASTNYTLNIRAVGENGVEGDSFEMSFVTRDAIPSAPKVFIANQGSSYLYIQWGPSDDILYGMITHYDLAVTPLEPKYGKYPSDCPTHNPFYQRLDGATTSYNYTQALGYWNYNISVSATTSQGTSPNRIVSATTNTAAPGIPRNLNLSDPETDDGSKNVTKFIRWDMPCAPNDQVSKYSVQLNGTYTEDESQTDFREHVFKVDSKQEHFNETLEGLNPSTTYVLKINAMGSHSQEGMFENYTFTTRDAIPDVPVLSETNIVVSNNSVTVFWDAPKEISGKISYYTIKFVPVAPLYSIPEDCPSINNTGTELNVSRTNFHEFSAYPYYNYTAAVAAATKRGLGDFATVSVRSSLGVPDKIRSLNISSATKTQEKYDAVATVNFKRPCFTNGPLQKIKIFYTGVRATFDEIIIEDSISFTENPNVEYLFALAPEYSYLGGITADNGEFSNTQKFDFTAPSGVPSPFPHKTVQLSGITLTGVDVTLKKDQFNNSNGDIKYISLILSEVSNNGAGTFGSWDGVKWPEVFSETEYQLTEDFWNPFRDADEVTFSIGNAAPGCSKSLKYCNEPLKEDKEYFLIIRMFTRNFYKNSHAIFFRTGKSWTSFILGMIFGILIAGILAITAFFLWRRGVFKTIMQSFPRLKKVKPKVNSGIPCGKFLQYCRNMECNPQKYHEEYLLLTEKSKEITAEKTISIATLLENKRKNRYTNIAPYDETRVLLRIDEDDEIGSDYINASFIKGYSGNIEYIATQGPMATTTRDFWKMVLQENVTLIVMVSQFVENGKDKCHRYFPKNHEIMSISEDMEVKCSTELHFGTYCVRNLQIRKDNFQTMVTHMQFLDWPDFGVPVGTENVLQFCYQLRERTSIEGGLIIVHCSAGVGRTGTLIATDILLQTANAGKNIDIFNTVLELRKQRVLMVQTDKQYIFIHNLLKEHLDRPQTPDLIENSEPMYENMEIIRNSRDSENFVNKKEDESEF